MINDIDKPVNLSSERLYVNAPCIGKSQREVADERLCLLECELYANCLHYSVNADVTGYVAGMPEGERQEWIRKALLSGEKEGEITLRRCYQHVEFLRDHHNVIKDNLCKEKCVCSNINYESLYFDVQHVIQDQAEPKLDRVSDLPTYANPFIDGKDKEYLFNTKKYIGEEFFNEPDLLILGGKQSVPIDVKSGDLWTSKLSEKYNLKINNLSLLDFSIRKLMQNFFYHQKEFGTAQKTVMLLDAIYCLEIPIKTGCSGNEIIFNTFSFKSTIEDFKQDYTNDDGIRVKGRKVYPAKYDQHLEFGKEFYYKSVQDSLTYLNIMMSVSDLLGSKFYFVNFDEESDKILSSLNIPSYLGILHPNQDELFEFFEERLCDDR